MKKQYKHKKTGNIIDENFIPLWIIENSNDWELINPIEVGKVYKDPNSIFMILVKELREDNSAMSIGFTSLGEWFELRLFFTFDLIEATKEEWFERLKEEAVKRGLVKGVEFKSAFSGSNRIISDLYLNDFDLCSDSSVIMDSDTGKWATVIEEKKPILTTRDGVELLDENVFVHYIRRNEYNYYTTKALHFKENFKEHYSNCEMFSTKEKAQEYIDWNKPKYSLNDIAGCCNASVDFLELIENIKKLNK